MLSNLSRRKFLGALSASGAALFGWMFAGGQTTGRKFYVLNPDRPSNDRRGKSHNCSGCNACRKHAQNKLFATKEAAEKHRAHPHCRCTVQCGGTLPRDLYAALFGSPEKVAREHVDRRNRWVQKTLVRLS